MPVCRFFSFLFCLQAAVVITEQLEDNEALLTVLSGTFKALDARVFVVAIGSGVDEASVKQIASSEGYAYQVSSLLSIMTVATNISDQICNLEGQFTTRVMLNNEVPVR